MDEIDGWMNDAALEQQLAHASLFLMHVLTPAAHNRKGTLLRTHNSCSHAHPNSSRQQPDTHANATCNSTCQQQDYTMGQET